MCFQYFLWKLLIPAVVLWERNTVLGGVWVIHSGQSRQTGVGGEQLFLLAVLGEMDVCHWHVFPSLVDLHFLEHRQGDSVLPWRGQRELGNMLCDSIFCYGSFPTLHHPTLFLLQNAILLPWGSYIILSVAKKRGCLCFLLDGNVMLYRGC